MTDPGGVQTGTVDAGSPAADATSGPAPAAEPGRGETEPGTPGPTVSVVVTVTERPEPLADLYREYAGPVSEADPDAEFLFAAPSWRSADLDPLRELQEDGEQIRILEVGGVVTEAALLKAAAGRARGDVLLTLPAYYRVEADELPRLLEMVRRGGADLAVACRAPRRDPAVNRLQNRVFHGLLRLLVGTDLRDTACGVRAMRPEVLENVPLYGDFFRFLPVLADREGYRVREVETRQHRRDSDPRIYGPGTYVRRIIDLLGLFFITRFTYKPLRFFGLVGTALGGTGAVILAMVALQRLGGQALSGRPLLVLGVLLATLGVQAVALGLVGEIIVHFNAPERAGYRVLDETPGDEGGTA